MDLPWSTISITSVSGALGISYLAPQYAVAGSFFLTLIVLEVTGIFIGVLWQAILYPKYFSPLRHVPTVPVSISPTLKLAEDGSLTRSKGGSFLMGQWPRIIKDVSHHSHVYT